MLGAFGRAATAFLPADLQRRRFGRLLVLGNLVGRGSQVVQDFQRQRRMFLMKCQQLFEYEAASGGIVAAVAGCAIVEFL